MQRIWGWNHLAKSWARRRPWEAWGNPFCVQFTYLRNEIEVYISCTFSNFGVSFFNSIGRLSGSRVCAPLMNQWKAIRLHHWCGCWPAYFFLTIWSDPWNVRNSYSSLRGAHSVQVCIRLFLMWVRDSRHPHLPVIVRFLHFFLSKASMSSSSFLWMALMGNQRKVYVHFPLVDRGKHLFIKAVSRSNHTVTSLFIILDCEQIILVLWTIAVSIQRVPKITSYLCKLRARC